MCSRGCRGRTGELKSCDGNATGLPSVAKKKGPTADRRKSLCIKVREQDLNLHPLAGTRPSTLVKTSA